MVSNIHTDFTANNHKDILNIENTAELLGISTATVCNWIKCGYLSAYNKNNKYFLYRRDIERTKLKLLNGELEKLNQRANKTKAKKTFIPKEHIKDKFQLNKLISIINFIQINNIRTEVALFLLSLNFLKKEKILLKMNIQDILQKKKLSSKNKQIQKEVNSWFLEIKKTGIKKHFSFLLDCELPEHRDILGILYQSLLFEGKKSQSGSYYTPINIVDNIITDYVKKDSEVLDPCCGTGQFLLAFSDIVEDPLNIYGIDYDKIAVRIARLNILTKFKNKNFEPNIFCKNTLFDIENDHSKFDVIATNPPWGAHFSKVEIKKLKTIHPQITSFESFSYFLKKSLNWLSRSGTISFILPESILNVRIHKDIREIILKTTKVKKIVYLNRVFKNVFTPVIRLDLKKNSKTSKQTVIHNVNKKHKIHQIKWMSNHDFIFDIHSSKFDSQIIDKVYRKKHITLKNNASWALGIVTGNNKKFITSNNKKDFEPIYKGKDVKRFILDKPSSYIQFQPEKLQQAAPEKKYRSKEKLIYRFISKNLIFAYDNKQSLTLNSANILISEIPNYPIKVIAALFNSSLYQFIFQKKFSSVKVLRSHIEELPLPLWNKSVFSKIIKLVDKTIQNQEHFQELDDYIISKFSLLQKEKIHIKKITK